MLKTNRLPVLVFLGAIFSLVLLVVVALSGIWENKSFVNEPLHSTLEALGGMCAAVLAVFLLQGKSEQDIEKYSPLALGFLSMGILDGFHAVSRPGHAFILFHSLASLAGGVGAALIWCPAFVHWTKSINRRIPWSVAVVLIVLGIVITGNEERIPAMFENNIFTPAAIGINLAAGVLFVLAAAYFLVDFFHFHRIESYLFSCLYLLFGLSNFEFPLSAAWNANWWFWHLQRLGAYVVVLYFLFHTFHRLAVERDQLILELHDALGEVKQLSGLLPICASCKQIRDGNGQWKPIEAFISDNSEAEFTHGLCPDCARKALTELDMLKGEHDSRQT